MASTVAASTTPARAEADPRAAAPARESNRDLVEQIVIALILAFLLRGFIAEAFVIPTGSMAPTLMGRHKELACPQCGKVYLVNASDEVEYGVGDSRVIQGTCQNCRAPAPLKGEPSYKGDRILVMKFLYDFGFLSPRLLPHRWDVVVFKYPEEPEVNYIKRLVGLPGETLRIRGGDILRRPPGSSEPFRRLHRPLDRQQAMQILVWDDAHRPRALAGRPEWARWAPAGASGWKPVEDPNRPGFEVAATVGQTARLQYRNLVPDPVQWTQILAGETPSTPPRTSLVTDFYSYNTQVMSSRGYDAYDWFQPHWVGDLTLTFDLESHGAAGTLAIELVSSGITNRCEIDLATRDARLFHGDRPLGSARIDRLDPGRRTRIVLANVDGRLSLLCGSQAVFGDGVVYDEGSDPPPPPTAADLEPARLAVTGAQARVSRLTLERDLYYTLDPGRSDFDFIGDDPSLTAPDPFSSLVGTSEDRITQIFDLLGNPRVFPQFLIRAHRDFEVRPGHYLMLGDNSPRSKDSRGWSTDDQIRPDREGGWDPNNRQSWEVPASLLIGRAFFVYWPHGQPFWPRIPINPDFLVPFRPYVERMKWIE